MLEGSIAFTLSCATNSQFKALFQFGSLTIIGFERIEKLVFASLSTA